jgi:DNA primase
LVFSKGVGDLRKAHREYLRGRGFDVEALISLWRIQAIGIASRLQWRVFIPIFYHGEVVSWTTRSISDRVEMKYITARPTEEKMPSKSVLYGEDYAGHSVLIHEGPLDVWKVGPGALCTLGTSFSIAQVEKLSKYPRRVVCYDAEREAQQRARSLCDLLAPYDGETLNVLLDSKDPGSASDREIKRLRRMLK